MALRNPMVVGRNKQQGPQGVEEPQQAHQVRAGHDPGGVRLQALRAARHGAAQGVQGQAPKLKFIKKRVGAHIRAKRKREELSNVLAAKKD
ncbi:60S ribosomal protein L36 [Sigmodon hispidus]